MAATANLFAVQHIIDGDGDTDSATAVNPLTLKFEDDGPTITVGNASGNYQNGASGVWDHDPGTDTFKSLGLTLNSYAIDDGNAATNDTVTVNTSLGTKTTTDVNGNYVFTGSVTADFTPNDGVTNQQTVAFTLTFDPDDDSYNIQLTTPPGSITKFDTSQGSLKAGGPDAVQTLEFPPAGHTNDIVFFGAVPTAPIENVAGEDNDIEDLVKTDPTEAALQAKNVPGIISASAQMNVSTSGIGINNNNLNGADQGSGTGAFAGTTITSGDESFVVNPEKDVDAVRVYIDNSVGGYDPATEDLYYTTYFTDGTVSAPLDVTAAALKPVPKTDPLNEWPDSAQGGKYFEIDGGAKKIEAVQLTMGLGVVKIPVIEFMVETAFKPAPLALNLTADLFDGDGDNHQDSFSINLVDATV
jgi:hypothetical protein